MRLVSLLFTHCRTALALQIHMPTTHEPGTVVKRGSEGGSLSSGLQAVADGDIRIVPERFEKVYNMWLSGIRDWCVSRQLWWGHRIPVW